MYILPGPFTLNNQTTGRTFVTAAELSVGSDLSAKGEFGDASLGITEDGTKYWMTGNGSHFQANTPTQLNGGAIWVITKPYDPVDIWTGWSNPRAFVNGVQQAYVRGDILREENTRTAHNLDTPTPIWHPVRQKWMWYVQARPGEVPGWPNTATAALGSLRLLMVGESDTIDPTDPNWKICWDPNSIVLASSDYPALKWMQGFLDARELPWSWWGGLDECCPVWNSVTQEIELLFNAVNCRGGVPPAGCSGSYWWYSIAHARSTTGAGKFTMDQTIPTFVSGWPQVEASDPVVVNPEGFPPKIFGQSNTSGWGNTKGRSLQASWNRDKFGRYHMWVNQIDQRTQHTRRGIGIAHYYSDDKNQWYGNPNNPMITISEMRSQSGYNVDELAAPHVLIDETAGQWRLTWNASPGETARGTGTKQFIASSPLAE